MSQLSIFRRVRKISENVY